MLFLKLPVALDQFPDVLLIDRIVPIILRHGIGKPGPEPVSDKIRD
jgi:hypothetical protein